MQRLTLTYLRQAIAEKSLSAQDGAFKQKTTKDGSDLRRPDDITFKMGVSAAKEGHSGKENSHMSDPKKVVAAAHTEREDRKEAKKQSKEVDESAQAADAKANNEKSDEEADDSQAVHDSENARKANAINEEEESDKED